MALENTTGKSGKYLDDFGLDHLWSKIKNIFKKKLDLSEIDRQYLSSYLSQKITWTSRRSNGGIYYLFKNTNSFYYRVTFYSGLIKEGALFRKGTVNYINKEGEFYVYEGPHCNLFYNVGDIPFVFNKSTNYVGIMDIRYYSNNGEDCIQKIEGWLYNNSQDGSKTENFSKVIDYTDYTINLVEEADYRSGGEFNVYCETMNFSNVVDVPYHPLESCSNPKAVYTFGEQTINGIKKFSQPIEYTSFDFGPAQGSHALVTAGGLYDALSNLGVSGKQDTITGAASTAVTNNFTADRVVITNSDGKLEATTGVTRTELGYLDGVTSAIQTQLNGKQASITGGASTITSSNLTASRALISNSSGKVAVSAVTSTELGYLDGVTSAIQTQLNGKASTAALTDGSVTKVGTATKGSSTQPIYLSSGSPTTCSTYAGGTKVTLNGTAKGATTASFYAPTSVGTKTYLLQSNGSGAPTWTNSIRPAAIEMLPGSTSAGHGGYIDFHYNNSEEDYTSRIIDMANTVQLVGKPLTIMGCTLFLGASNNYTVTADDKVWLICSHGANTITLDNSGGWTNREIYLFSPVNSSNTVSYYTRTDGSTLGTVTMNMLRNKMYHFIFYSGSGWICDNPNVETSRYDTSSNYTLADFGIGRIYAGSSSAAITITLPDTQVYEGREVIVTNSFYSNKNITVSYKQNQSGNSSITLTALNSARFVGAISSTGTKYWLEFN